MNTYTHHPLHFEGLESRRLLAVEIMLTGSAELLDLRAINLDDIAKVDICGCGDTTVMIDAQWIGESGLDGTMKVVADRGDSVDFMDTGWQFSTAKAEGEQIVREFKNNDATLNLIGPDAFTNPVNHFDVNGSGDLTSADVLAVINELNARRFSDGDDGTIGDVATMPLDQFNFYDVSRNLKITANDALCAINEIARQSNAGDAAADVAEDAVLPPQFLASDAVVVQRISSSEDPAVVDAAEKQSIDPYVGLVNDLSSPRPWNQQQPVALLDTTDEESSLSPSLVDTVLERLDATLELSPELESWVG